MNAKKRICILILAVVMILLQLTPTIFQSQIIDTKTTPNQSASQPNISELFVETEGMPNEFFVGVDKKCDLIVMANDPDWDMIRLDIYIQLYIQGNQTIVLIHTIWSPQNGQRYRINLAPMLINYRDNINVEAEVTDSYEMKGYRNVNFNVRNIFGMEYYRNDRGQEILNNYTWVFPAEKDRNVQKIDILDSQYIYDSNYQEKKDYEFNFTLVWDQKTNSSDKMYFGFRAGHFLQRENYNENSLRIQDSSLPSNYKSILAGEYIRDDWSRVAGFYFTIQPVNQSDLIMPWIMKVTYPAWYEPKDPQNKPLRLLRFNNIINKWEVLDQSAIVKKADPNTVELFINSTGLFAFGRYSWDYEEDIRSLERYESIPAFPFEILTAISVLGLVSLILKTKRRLN